MTLEAVRSWYKRYFELLIWTALLREQAKNLRVGMTNQRVTTPLQVFANLKDHVPWSLLRYWLYRFTDPNTGEPFAEASALPRPGGGSFDRAVPSLSHHMQALAKAMNKDPVGLVTAGPLAEK